MSTDGTKFNPNDPDHQLIMAAMANLADRGVRPRDIFILLDQIKSQTFQGLSDIYDEGVKNRAAAESIS